MCEPSESSQLQSWLFTSKTLAQVRSKANRLARKSLSTSSRSRKGGGGGDDGGSGGGDVVVEAAAATTTTTTTTTVSSSGDNHSAVTTDNNNNNNPDASGGGGGAAAGDSSTAIKAECFARDFNNNSQQREQQEVDDDEAPWETSKGYVFLTPHEEQSLVTFYASRLPDLIGPKAQVSRLRKDSKVTATASLLFRRFYLSNSVMRFDPKVLMVAAAFLASKVEDATTLVGYLEEATNRLGAPVSIGDIISAEIFLLSGIHFDLLCFHPYKAVLAITEDLRTYLKSQEGRTLVQFTSSTTSTTSANTDDTTTSRSSHSHSNRHRQHRPISGQDLFPMHEMARQIVDDIVVSDLPLLYTPAQLGLAALMVANEEQLSSIVVKQEQDGAATTTTTNDNNSSSDDVPQIDFMGYLHQRFPSQSLKDKEGMQIRLKEICSMIRQLKSGDYGCGIHYQDMSNLKSIRKKLKKVSRWTTTSSTTSSSTKKDKKRKRKNDDDDDEEDRDKEDDDQHDQNEEEVAKSSKKKKSKKDNTVSEPVSL